MIGWLRKLRATAREADELGDLPVATAIFVRRALEGGCADEGLSLIMHGCKLRGVPVGDWEFTARRINPSSAIEGRRGG